MQGVEGEVLNETNLLQTLQQHGLALSADDLHTLRNFIKPCESAITLDQQQQQSSALGNELLGSNGLLRNKDGAVVTLDGAAAAGMCAKPTASVALTLSNGQVIQLSGSEPFVDPPKVQFVAQYNSQGQPQVLASHPPLAQQPQEVAVVPTVVHGFQNEFLEDLARSQIVPDPKKVKSKATPAPKNNITTTPGGAKKTPQPKKKPPPKSNAAKVEDSPTIVVTLPAPQVATCASTGTTPTSSVASPSVVQRVQTIKLSPQNQQV